MTNMSLDVTKITILDIFKNVFTVVFCSAPVLENGVINYDRPRHNIDHDAIDGTIATFSCDDGYSLSGSSSSVCQADRTWDPQTPTCGNEINYNCVFT